jgi:hypothetical protein
VQDELSLIDDTIEWLSLALDLIEDKPIIDRE